MRDEDELLTVAEIAGRLKVKEETVRRWLRTGKLRGVIFSDSAGYRVKASEVTRFIEGSPARGERPKMAEAA